MVNWVVVVSIQRWAGDAMKWYEGEWNKAVTGGLRPVDRLIASDEDRLSGVSAGISSHLAEQVAQRPSEPMSGRALELLQQLDPTGGMASAFGVVPPGESQSIAAKTILENLNNADGHDINEVARTTVYQSAQKRKIAEENIRSMVDSGVVPDSFLMSRGTQLARDLLANPMMAYGLPAAGAGLAAWGLHDVLTAQQRAEKESQLPLQGGVQ